MISYSGYVGKVLRVNLSSETVISEDLDIAFAKAYIGGTGFGVKFLFDEVGEGVNSFDPENCIIIATGPLNGTNAPGSSPFSVVTKSPLTGLVGAAQANGSFGPRLKFAGFDAVVIKGAAERFVYLYLHDGKAEIREADFLVGKDTFETEEILRDLHDLNDDKKGSVLTIGPAGENCVSFACINTDKGHIAASGGVGGVMGSKKLKAIVVEGNRKDLVPQKNRDDFKKLIRTWTLSAKESPLGKAFSSYGTAANFAAYHEKGWVPVKNLTTNDFPEFKRFDGTSVRSNESFKFKRKTCSSCPLSHTQDLEVTTGPYKGLYEEPEYEDFAGWGPNIGVSEPAIAIKLTDYNDRLGMDLKESTFLISLIMECYEKGLLTSKELDGIEANWGDEQSVIALLRQIAYKDGFGKVMSGGVMRTAFAIGGEAPNYAVYVKKGNAPHVHDPRTRWGTIFTQAISNMGSQEGIDLTFNRAPDLGITEPVGFSEQGIPIAQAKSGPKRQLEDCLVVCYFLCRGNDALKHMVEALNLTTGWDFSQEEALKVGERIINLMRVFNFRHGFSVEHDSVSPRLLEAPKSGPGKGQSLAPIFDNARRLYYRQMGWDEETGKPLSETLRRLELESCLKYIRPED